MNHQDHVNLLRRGIPEPGGKWADFGSGTGAFTLALRELVGAEGELFSIDKDRHSLDEQQRNFRRYFPDSNIHFLHTDFTRRLDLPPLDGVVMANSLHYFRDKLPVLQHVRQFLKEQGRLILVEYNVDRGNFAVPYPLSFETFRRLAPAAGFGSPQLLATVPSRFLGEFYSALAVNLTPPFTRVHA